MTNNCANVMRKYASMNKQAGLGSILNALKNSKFIGIPQLMYGLKHNPKAVKSALLRAGKLGGIIGGTTGAGLIGLVGMENKLAQDRYDKVTKQSNKIQSLLKNKRNYAKIERDAIDAESDLMRMYLTGGGALAGGAIGAGVAGEGNRILGGTLGTIGGGGAGLLAHYLGKKYGYLS